MDSARSTERDFKRTFAAWPSYLADSLQAAWRAWRKLSVEEQAAAMDRAPDYVADCSAGKRSVCAFGVYLSEKRWQGLPPRIVAPTAPIVAKPFSRLWTAVRLARLADGPGPLPQPSAFIGSLIAQGGEVGERERLAHQARFGFPAVNRMDDAADRFVGHTMRPDDARLERLAEAFERVHAKSDVAAAWKAEHARRGWPWLPDPGSHEWFYFPAGGPAALAKFEQAMRGEHDGGGREAAE